jgi:hypothetical protein
MSERFTGFWEDSGTPEREPHVMMTEGPIDVDDLLERLRARLHELEPGVNVRIDLISWDGP